MKFALPVLLMAAFAPPALAQQVMDGSDKQFGSAVAGKILDYLIGKTPDPYSAQIIKLKQPNDKSEGDLCGLVNLKNQYGGYSGFQPFMIYGGNFFLQDTSQCR